MQEYDDPFDDNHQRIKVEQLDYLDEFNEFNEE